MFINIDVERAKRKMSIKELSRETGIVYDTLLSKINGKSEFTLSEMLKIRDCLNPSLTLEYLFVN